MGKNWWTIFFNLNWFFNSLKQTSFPVHLLPQVVEPGGKAGNLQFDWLAVKKGTPVLVALGDTQCAVYSILQNPHEAGTLFFSFMKYEQHMAEKQMQLACFGKDVL